MIGMILNLKKEVKMMKKYKLTYEHKTTRTENIRIIKAENRAGAVRMARRLKGFNENLIEVKKGWI